MGGGAAIAAFAALAIYVVILPMRQTRFQVVEHRLLAERGRLTAQPSLAHTQHRNQRHQRCTSHDILPFV